MMELPRLLRHPAWRRVDPRQGRGVGVVLVPGFGFGDTSLLIAARWLRARGYRPVGARIGLNVGCTTELVERLEKRVVEHARETGGRVVLFGQSRGGWLARLVAGRRPDLVRGLVMLGSPVLNPLGAHPAVVRVARFLARASAWGVPGLLDEQCFTGDCYDTSMAGLAAPLPSQVPALAIFSARDIVAPPELCRDPSAECVEVRSTHTGMGLDPDVYAAVEPRLAQWAAREGAQPDEALRAAEGLKKLSTAK
ncbi:alpha/beta fold hydrolase [Saccharothrix variisporea]|nr:alpha/beta fold hydrolase [Saccharothrix variisporea]